MGNTVPAGPVNEMESVPAASADVAVNDTVHRAPVAPATAGDTDTETEPTELAPATEPPPSSAAMTANNDRTPANERPLQTPDDDVMALPFPQFLLRWNLGRSSFEINGFFESTALC